MSRRTCGGLLAAVVIACAIGLVMAAESDSDGSKSYKQGVELMDKGQVDQAIASFTEAIRLTPTNPEAYLARGFAYCRKQPRDLQKAIADFTEAIRLRPGNGKAHRDRAYAYSELCKYDLAIRDFNEAIRIRSEECVRVQRTRSCVLQHAKTRQSNQGSHRSDPTQSNMREHFLWRGFANEDKNDQDKAMADYNEAIRLVPSSAEAYQRCAYLYSRRGDFARVIDNMTDAIRIVPNNALYYAGRAGGYIGKEDYDSRDCRRHKGHSTRLKAGASVH